MGGVIHAWSPSAAATGDSSAGASTSGSFAKPACIRLMEPMTERTGALPMQLMAVRLLTASEAEDGALLLAAAAGEAAAAG